MEFGKKSNWGKNKNEPEKKKKKIQTDFLKSCFCHGDQKMRVVATTSTDQ